MPRKSALGFFCAALIFGLVAVRPPQTHDMMAVWPLETVVEAETKSAAPPVKLAIPHINLEAPVVSVGLDENRLMAVPADPYTVSWWKYGAKPGDPGNTILAGHFRIDNGDPGVFFNLNQVKVGDEVVIADQNQQDVRFVVKMIQEYKTEEFPTRGIYGATATESRLILITCSGKLLNGNYDHRIVITAEKI